jgi:hypothetical protein
MPKAIRSMSIASRVWLAAHELCPPCSIQMIFEGKGTFHVEHWCKAVAAASDANPGSRLILKGHLAASRWVDSGATPPVRVIDGSGWDGMSSEGAEILHGGFSPSRGPMAEVVLVLGDPLRVAIRAHHAVMDGRGCLTWAKNIFRALRGEPVLASDDTMTENDLLNLTESKPVASLGRRFTAPTGPARGSETGISWRRAKIANHYSWLLPRTIMLTAQEAWRHNTGTVRVSIPIDMRSRRPGLRSTGNLTNAIFINVTPSDTPSSIAYEILRRLKSKQDGRLTLEEMLIPHIPLWLLKRILRKEARQGHLQGTYRCSGFISDLGKIPIDAYQGGGFISVSYVALPVCLESFPFSMTMSNSGNEINLVLSMPKILASGGRLEESLGRIKDGLLQSKNDIRLRRGCN